MSEREADIYGDIDDITNIPACDMKDSAPDSGLEIASVVEHEAHDLYDDIYSFETRRERQQAAEIKRLHEDLHNLTKRLAAEETQNQVLRRNLESLLVTARTELTRKGAEIKELQRTIIRYQTGKRSFNEVPSSRSGVAQSVHGISTSSLSGSFVSPSQPMKGATTSAVVNLPPPSAKPDRVVDVRLPLLSRNACNEQERERCAGPPSNEHATHRFSNLCNSKVSETVVGSSPLEAATPTTSHLAGGRDARSGMNAQTCGRPVTESLISSVQCSLTDKVLAVNRTDVSNAFAGSHPSTQEPNALDENSCSGRALERRKESSSLVQQPVSLASSKVSEDDRSLHSEGPCISQGLSPKRFRSSSSSEASRAHPSTSRSSAPSPTVSHRRRISDVAVSSEIGSASVISKPRDMQSYAEDVNRHAREQPHSPAHPKEYGVLPRTLPCANETKEIRDAAARGGDSGSVSSKRPEVIRTREQNSRKSASSHEDFPAEHTGPDRAREPHSTPKGFSPHFVDEGSGRRRRHGERTFSTESRNKVGTGSSNCLANRELNSPRRTSDTGVSKSGLKLQTSRQHTAYHKEPGRRCATNSDELDASRGRKSRDGIASEIRLQGQRFVDLAAPTEAKFYEGHSYSHDVSQAREIHSKDALCDERDRQQLNRRASRDERVKSDLPGVVRHLKARRNETADRNSDRHPCRNNSLTLIDRESRCEEHARRRPSRTSPTSPRLSGAPSHCDNVNWAEKKTREFRAERATKRSRADVEEGEVLSE